MEVLFLLFLSYIIILHGEGLYGQVRLHYTINKTEELDTLTHE